MEGSLLCSSSVRMLFAPSQCLDLNAFGVGGFIATALAFYAPAVCRKDSGIMKSWHRRLAICASNSLFGSPA